jgi:hypothetical protein
VLICKIWTRKQRQAKAAAERKAMENIDEELASATRNKHKNKHMKSIEPINQAVASQLSISSIGEISADHLTSTNVENVQQQKRRNSGTGGGGGAKADSQNNSKVK